MAGASRLSSDPREPLGLTRRAAPAPADWPDLRAVRFEFSSRGDRVPARLLLPPEDEGPLPVVLLQHGAGGSKQADYIEHSAGPWVRGGAAVVSIDFPLHGERSSGKLSERFLGGVRQYDQQSAEMRLLVSEFFAQAVVDLRRTVDALEQLNEVDAKRLAYASFSLGTVVGVTFCSLDARPRAAAFALGGGGMGPPELDPARAIGGFAPRPVLFVNTTRDEVFPRDKALALYESAGEPREQLWFEGAHGELPGAALKAMWVFLRRHLGID